VHKEDVISLTYQYIAMMKKAGPQEWIWNELRLLGDIDFRFMAKKKPMSTATNLASSMQYFPSEDILRGHYIYSKYDPALIQHCMDQLTVANSFVVYIAKEYAGQTNQVERWYGSHFAVEDIPAEVKAAWENANTIDSELHLPEPNLFIPDDFTFFEAEDAEQTVPKLVRDGEISKVWFMQDTLYKLPKAVVNLQIYSKDCYSSARNTIITHFCTLLVQDALNEYAYDAQIAGLDYKVEYNSEGIAVTVRGYNQKLGLLTNKIFNKLKHLEIKADRFAVVHEQMRRDYSNFSREAPHAHARYFMMMATIEPRWGWEEKLPILESITQSDLENFLPTILRSVRLQWLIHGNIRSKDALALVDDVERIIDPCPMRVPFLPVQRAVKFQKGHTYIMHRQEYNDQESNSALYNWYQAGHQDDTKHAAVMDLMQEILSEPCYDVLRTKEQVRI
jgi:insulysin